MTAPTFGGTQPKVLRPVTRSSDANGVDQSPELIGYSHHCPGCNHLHVFYTKQFYKNNPVWAFDGNLVAPTFSPSMSVKWEATNPPQKHTCHYNLEKGIIIFHGDSTHALANQRVPLPPHSDQE